MSKSKLKRIPMKGNHCFCPHGTGCYICLEVFQSENQRLKDEIRGCGGHLDEEFKSQQQRKIERFREALEKIAKLNEPDTLDRHERSLGWDERVLAIVIAQAALKTEGKYEK